jgi:hypothetical protein
MNNKLQSFEAVRAEALWISKSVCVGGLKVTPLAISGEDEKGNLDTRLDVLGVGSTRKNG